LFRTLAYRLQADQLGDLDADTRRALNRLDVSTADGFDRLVTELNRSGSVLRSGTLLTREWDGHLHRVMVLADGFGWNGKTYKSPVQGCLRNNRLALERATVFWFAGSAVAGGTVVKNGPAKPVRCAIYTRVSTDHGLEQDFNSLDAQYDASQAYIRSQVHAGWTLIRSRYGRLFRRLDRTPSPAAPVGGR
jgi:hypothetical protein